MRKITSTVASAFIAKLPKSMGNTSTDGKTMFLHGNAIARHGLNGLEFNLAGWPTVTTRERINGALHASGSGNRVFQKDHDQKYCAKSIPNNGWIDARTGNLVQALP